MTATPPRRQSIVTREGAGTPLDRATAAGMYSGVGSLYLIFTTHKTAAIPLSL